jgi:hypothetical protein
MVDDFNHDTFTLYDGHLDPKQFLMSYEATISSYGGNAAVMAKSFVMAVRNVAQTWYSFLFGQGLLLHGRNSRIC